MNSLNSNYKVQGGIGRATRRPTKGRQVGVLVVALLLLGPLPDPLWAQANPTAVAAKDLPPLIYVCPMPNDAAVIEDKPGKCPVCGMTLVPTRIDSKWWCPTHQTIVVRDAPGKCPIDHRDLVQVTLAEHWTCAGDSDKQFLEPGVCADGQARKIGYALRAHGDHNPRHDGQFFMAADQWHHLEGTYPEVGLFRAYFYDNFTRPIPVDGFSGSVTVYDKNDRPLGSFPLTVAKGGQTMEAKIPPALAGLPFRAAANVKFDPKLKEQRFDFNFATYSNDPNAHSGPVKPTVSPQSLVFRKNTGRRV